MRDEAVRCVLIVCVAISSNSQSFSNSNFPLSRTVSPVLLYSNMASQQLHGYLKVKLKFYIQMSNIGLNKYNIKNEMLKINSKLQQL